ncbi:hypothetical protein AVEN_225437-1 [Araneus ventricosus]|uniref:Uncharacterized protein n=1 Tax=Araneus ventricosus TaxID=182803 RepID=A0A4Y2ND18_ARAVE|nr:hypothetical protein AVEN_225437-1 [Araneus ventricosus]
MSRGAIGNIMFSGIEILQILQNLFETDSGSYEKSDLSQDAYIPGIESEPTSSDECFTEIAQNVQGKLHKTYTLRNVQGKNCLNQSSSKRENCTKESSQAR